MPPTAPPPVDRFLECVGALDRWPDGVVPVPQLIDPPAFFPASTGLWHTAADAPPAFPYDGVMVVGHNLDSEDAYTRRLTDGTPHGGETSRMPTWRNLLATLDRADIDPARCFFTNAYVGLKAGANATGKFAGEDAPEFRAWCERFLVEHAETMRPAAVVALGGPARRFLARLSPNLGAWDVAAQRKVDDVNAGRVGGVRLGTVTSDAVTLVHPSFGARHVGGRRYVDRNGRTHTGADAEAAMLVDATA
jgi:hypothetical protein